MFESFGFMCSEADHSLFYKDEDSDLLVVAVYVNDKLIFLKNLDAIKCLKSQLSDHFEIMDLGKAWWTVKSGSSPGQSPDEFWIKGTRMEEQRLA